MIRDTMRWLIAGLIWLAAGSALGFTDDANWRMHMVAAGAAWERGDYAETERQLSAAVKEAEAYGRGDGRLVAALDGLADLNRLLGNYRSALALYGRALKLRRVTLGPDHAEVALGLNNIAQLHQMRGDFTAAEPLFKQSLAIYRATLGPRHAHVATLLNNLAELYHARGRHAEAETGYREAIAIWEISLGPAHGFIATALENYAALLHETGRGAEAVAPLARARRIRARPIDGGR